MLGGCTNVHFHLRREKVGEDLDLLKAASHERLKTAIELYNRATSFSNIVNVPTTLTNNDLAITNLFNEVITIYTIFVDTSVD